jgi:hypothetical protein
MSAGRIALVVFAAIVAVLAFVWVKGGREPLREIAQPIAVPESAK